MTVTMRPGADVDAGMRLPLPRLDTGGGASMSVSKAETDTLVSKTTLDGPRGGRRLTERRTVSASVCKPISREPGTG